MDVEDLLMVWSSKSPRECLKIFTIVDIDCLISDLIAKDQPSPTSSGPRYRSSKGTLDIRLTNYTKAELLTGLLKLHFACKGGEYWWAQLKLLCYASSHVLWHMSFAVHDRGSQMFPREPRSPSLGDQYSSYHLLPKQTVQSQPWTAAPLAVGMLGDRNFLVAWVGVREQ